MTDSSFQPDAERIISDLDTLKIYFDTTRLQIMKAVGVRACSVNELAHSLNVPFTRLYYHINLLEKYDLIRMVDVRSISGAAEEKYYRATANVFIIDRNLLTVGTPQGDAGLELMLTTVLDYTKTDITRSAQSGDIDMTKYPPDAHALSVRRGVYNLTEAGAALFHQRIRDFLQESAQLDQEPNTPATRYYGFTIAFYPTTLENVDPNSPHSLPDDED